MPSLIDSGRVWLPGFPGPQLSVRQSASACGFTFPLSLRDFLSTPTPGCPFPECVRLHIKVLQAPDPKATPPQVTIEASLKNMQQVYRTAGIRAEVGSREDFTNDPAFSTLLNINVGPCQTPQTLSPNQQALFANNTNVGPNDVAVYFVSTVTRTTPTPSGGTISGVLFGCAAPTNARSVVIAAPTATPWTLAHEVAHVLGCVHISGENTGCPSTNPNCCSTPDPTSLMTGCGTNLITGIPTVSPSEISAMKNSGLSQTC
jgi:hypothetical protein